MRSQFLHRSHPFNRASSEDVDTVSDLENGGWRHQSHCLLEEGLFFPGEGDRYNEKTSSRYFPNINVQEAITDCFRIAYERNTSTAIRELRRKLESEN